MGGLIFIYFILHKSAKDRIHILYQWSGEYYHFSRRIDF